MVINLELFLDLNPSEPALYDDTWVYKVCDEKQDIMPQSLTWPHNLLQANAVLLCYLIKLKLSLGPINYNLNIIDANNKNAKEYIYIYRIFVVHVFLMISDIPDIAGGLCPVPHDPAR